MISDPNPVYTECYLPLNKFDKGASCIITADLPQSDVKSRSLFTCYAMLSCF